MARRRDRRPRRARRLRARQGAAGGALDATRADRARFPARRSRRSVCLGHGGQARGAELRARGRHRPSDGGGRGPRLGGRRLHASDPPARIAACDRGRRASPPQPVEDPSRERRPGLVALEMTCKSGGTVDLYVEPQLPNPRLVVFGITPAARTLVRIGHAMGYRVDVIDPDAEAAAFPEAARVMAEVSPDAVPQGAYVLVATMDERDLEAIESLVPFMPAYLGVIASKKRFAELRDALAARGIPRAVVDRIAAPAGLDIGARTPEEIALSVMAQIVEQRRRPAKEAPATKPAASTDAPREAIDPVCGMTVAIAGARHAADAGGRRYYFCCAGCRERFLADPARYAAART